MSSLVTFDTKDLARIVVEQHGTKRELPIGDLTAAAGSPGALGALIANGLRVLRPMAFVADADAGALVSVAHLTVIPKTGASESLELLRADRDVYVRMRYGLARLPMDSDRLLQFIEQAIATAP